MNNRTYIDAHKGHPHYHDDKEIKSLKASVQLSSEDENTLLIIRALSDPTKLKIFMVLSKVEEIAVSDLTIILDISQSAVSHALADMKKIGLVESRRCGQLVCYSLIEYSDLIENDPKLGFFGKMFKTNWYVEV